MSATKTQIEKFPGWDFAEFPSFLEWNRLRHLRRRAKLNRSEVSVFSGVSLPTIANIEAGFDSRTTPETKRKLAEFFRCEIDDLFPVAMIGSIPKEVYLRQKLEQDKANRGR